MPNLYTWVAGNTGGWDTAANWTGGPGAYPVAGDNVDFTGTATVNADAGAGATITVSAMATFTGGADITADQLYIAVGGDVEITGGAMFDATLLNIDDTLTVDGGGTLTSGDTTIGFTAGGAGTMTVDGMGTSWTDDGLLNIGDVGMGASLGQLTVSDGADVSVGVGNDDYTDDYTFVGDGGGLTITGASTFETNALNIAGHTTTLDTKSTLTVDGDATDGGNAGPAAIYDNFVFNVDDATIDADGSILIGNHAAASAPADGTAYMTVQDGATVTDDFMALGWEADNSGLDDGRLTIEGADTTWTDNGDAGGDQAGGAYIGVQAAGNVDLTEGATLTEEGGSHFTGVYAGAILGVDDGVHGGMVVEDGATWTIDNDLVVGFYGQGELTVRPGNYADAAGGTVTADNLIISQYADDVGYGQVYVEGDGSTITLDGEVTVGGGGTGELHISDGGVVESDGLTIGADEGGGQYQPTGNFLDITGDNSALTSTGEAQIGVASDGSITLEEGGELTTADATLGVDADITGMATIGDDASQATWTINGDLTIGGDGNGTIEFGTDGGTLDVTGDTLTIAEGDGSMGTLTLQNADSTLTFDGDITIGDGGDGTLELEDGATYTSSGDIVIGAEDTGNGTLTLTGADTVFTAGDGTFTVGQDGSGLVEVEDTATLDASAADVTVGDGGDDTQSSVIDVNDATSSFMADNLTVGASGDSANKVTAESGGTIAVTETLIIGDAGNGNVQIDSGSSLTADEIDVGKSLGGVGELDIDGDKSSVVTMHDFNLGAYGTATLDISDSAGLTTDGDAMVGTQTEAVVQTVTLDSNGTWIVEGSLTIAAAGVATVTVQGGAQLSAYGNLTIADQAGSSATVTVQEETTTDPVVQSGIGYGGTLTVGNFGMATLDIADGGLVAHESVARRQRGRRWRAWRAQHHQWRHGERHAADGLSRQRRQYDAGLSGDGSADDRWRRRYFRQWRDRRQYHRQRNDYRRQQRAAQSERQRDQRHRHAAGRPVRQYADRRHRRSDAVDPVRSWASDRDAELRFPLGNPRADQQLLRRRYDQPGAAGQYQLRLCRQHAGDRQHQSRYEHPQSADRSGVRGHVHEGGFHADQRFVGLHGADDGCAVLRRRHAHPHAQRRYRGGGPARGRYRGDAHRGPGGRAADRVDRPYRDRPGRDRQRAPDPHPRRRVRGEPAGTRPAGLPRACDPRERGVDSRALAHQRRDDYAGHVKARDHVFPHRMRRA